MSGYGYVTCTSTARSPQEERHDLMVRLRVAYQSERQMDMETRLLLVDAYDELERIDHIIALRGKYRDALPPTRPWWRFWS
jgi:hypothetical protein